MASAAIPLPGEHLEVDLSTRHSPPNFSKPFGSPSQPNIPHTSLHEFRNFQQPPSVAPWPVLDDHRLRRKPPCRQLSTKLSVAVPGQPLVTREAPLFELLPSQNLSSSFTQPPRSPSTPYFHATATSPSLASTVSTLQSPAVQTPIAVGSSTFEAWSSTESIELLEPVRHKRKFPNIKQTKRLPRRGEGRQWCVYAAVVSGGSDLERYGQAGCGSESSVHVSETGEGKAFEGARVEGEGAVESRKGRSVRFTGVGEAGSSSGEEKDSSGEREPTADSTYTLAKFKFPTPPGYNWAGTFGHLSQPTPPQSPATLHYRGASFDVVNPHASLLLGTQDFETPAEIDGLLDDYFSRRGTSHYPYEDITGDMAESQQAGQTDSAGSRRTRLYTNPEDARRNIMRIPGVISQPAMPENAYQESPLARKGQDSGLPLSMSDLRSLEEGHGADINGHGGGPLHAERTVAANRVSSQYPLSVRSDPFDLHVSDDEQFDRIDELIATGHGSQYGEDDDMRHNGAGFAAYDEGANAQATASQQDGDTTIGSFIERYDYTTPLTPENLQRHQSSIEHTSAGFPADDAFDRVSAESFVTNPFETRDGDRRNAVSARLSGPPDLPVPPPPAHLPYNHDYTDVQTSEQTYGVTGELLQITPGPTRMISSSYPWPTGGTPMFLPAYPFVPFRDDDKENIPPGEFDMASDHGPGIPAAWSNADLPTHTRDRGLSGLRFVRNSSRYSQLGVEDDGWEDVQTSDSHSNLANLAGRPSEDSIADLTDDDASRRLSLPPLQGQPTLREVRSGSGTVIVQFANKAHRVLMDDPNEPKQHAPKRGESLKRAKQLLKANMMENRLMGSLANGLGSVEPQVIDREQYRRNDMELENIRKRNPSAVKAAVEQVVHENKKPAPVLFNHPYNPHDSFAKITQLAQKGDPLSVSSDRRGLLEGSPSPSPYGKASLAWSPSAGTFVTVRDQPPPLPSRLPAGHWSPLPEQPQPVMTPGRYATATPSTHRTGEPEEYELMPIQRCGNSRRTMTSQTSLLPFQLGASSNAKYNPGPGRALTDVELMEAESGWTMNPHRRSGSQFGLETTIQPMLIDAKELRNQAASREQKKISREYYNICMWCPVTALLFGLGYFDKKAEAKSQHGVKSMSEQHKHWALTMATPLGVLVYTLVTVVIVVLCTALHKF